MKSVARQCSGKYASATMGGVFRGVRAFSRSGPHREHSSPSIVSCIYVYRDVAWQGVDQIRYNINLLEEM
jgi:hypothetical protein